MWNCGPTPALIGRCDTTERFQGRFHAPVLSIAPRGDPTGSRQVRSALPACLIHTKPNQPNQSTNYPIRTHGWAPLWQTDSRKWTKTRPRVTDKEPRARRRTRKKCFWAQREMKTTQTSVITAAGMAKMMLLVFLSSLPSFIPPSRSEKSPWGRIFMDSDTHFVSLSCHARRKHRYITLWDWTRLENTNSRRGSLTVGGHTE